MTPREQAILEFNGTISKEDCTHFYHTLTYEKPYGTEGNRTIGYTCANRNCKEFFPHNVAALLEHGNLHCMHETDESEYRKPLGITNVQEAKDKIKDLEVFGDGDTWVLLCKASSKRQGWMKSTKVMNVPGGCVVQVTTQEQSHVAESLAYVPGVQIIGNDELRILAAIPLVPALGEHRTVS